MIPIRSGVRVWIATGHTDMLRGMNGLCKCKKRDPHAGDLFVFRGRRGALIKILWHDGLGMSLYAKRSPRPITEAACWSHGRRKFFVLADLATAPGKKHASPLALEALRRIDAIFAIEREISGLPAEQRLAVRTTRIAPLVSELESWMRNERARLSRHADVAKAMDYMLKRWAAFTRFLSDGRICLTNNAAERALRGIAIGRKNWLFAGSDRGGERAASMYTLIATAKLNNIDPQTWLADVLRRIADHPARRLHELLPWNWYAPTAEHAAA